MWVAQPYSAFCPYVSLKPKFISQIQFLDHFYQFTVKGHHVWGFLWWHMTDIFPCFPLGSGFALQGQPFYSKGQYLLLSAPLDTINIHVREGHIIPQQVGVCLEKLQMTKCGGWIINKIFEDGKNPQNIIETSIYNSWGWFKINKQCAAVTV